MKHIKLFALLLALLSSFTPACAEYIIEVPENALSPVWEGHTVYNESIMFLENETEARLLYAPTEILSVFSSDLLTEYVRGVDWEFEDGKLVRLPDSNMPYMPLSLFYPETEELASFACYEEGHPYLGSNLTPYQLAVTYRHDDVYQGFIPESQAEAFVRFHEKMARGEEVTVVFYGDSITAGWDTSGALEKDPHLPSFALMTTQIISEYYGYQVSIDADPIFPTREEPLSGERVLHYVNTSVSGMTTGWGVSNAESLAAAYQPDLLVIGFGMNDNLGSPLLPKQMNKLIKNVRETAPEVEVCVIATMIPHWRATGIVNNLDTFEGRLQEAISAEANVALAPMTSVHRSMLEIKEYYDLSANNINHPNDFLARVYAMTLLTTLGIPTTTPGLTK